MKSETDSPQVITFPPLIYVVGLLGGFLLHYIKPLVFFESGIIFYSGIVLIIISIGIFIASVNFFVKADTNVDVRKPTTSIVASGPYRFSRNPIYLSMTLLYLGVAGIANDPWFLLTLVPVLITIQYGVIKREEKYLEKKFGEEYTKYTKSVRRWL